MAYQPVSTHSQRKEAVTYAHIAAEAGRVSHAHETHVAAMKQDLDAAEAEIRRLHHIPNPIPNKPCPGCSGVGGCHSSCTYGG